MSITGQKASAFIRTNLGNGFATYAIVNGEWFSVNLDSSHIVTDVRWRATAEEITHLDNRMEIDV